MKKLLAFLTFFIAFAAQAQQAAPHDVASCATQIPFGQPSDTIANTVTICRQAYILQSDKVAKIPAWVAYTLTPPHATGCVKRSNAFEPDNSLPKGSRAELSDYAKSGYDIGHQANDGDMSWDITVEHESFILTNMAPQLPGFNRGIWKKLEDQIRGWSIDRQHNMTIYVGPVYAPADKTIGPNKVVVAHAFYKIVIDDVTNEVLVFEFSHAPSNFDLARFIVPLDEVQHDTGIKFPLPANATFPKALWPATDKNGERVKKQVCASH